MKITEVRINLVKNTESTLMAFASITIDDEFVVKGLRVIEGRKGEFVAYPASKGDDDNYYENAFPLNKDTRDYIEDEVLNAYYNAKKDAEDTPSKKSETRSGKRTSRR